MTLEFTENIIVALQVAFAEIDNCDEWQQFVSEKEHEQVIEGLSEIRKIARKENIEL